MTLEPPDWEGSICALCRYYKYKPDECGDLTWPQITALLNDVRKRPYELVAMCEPKKSGM